MIHSDYSNLISIENLFQAFYEFRKGKSKRIDVQEFERNLEDNLFELHQRLRNKTYKHGNYQSFYVQDPKQRHIHKAKVADRVVHHLLYTLLYKLFDSTFIYDSYSCRLDKGTHKGVKRLEKFTRQVSKNYTRSCWALKCDVKKFFASIDHEILLSLLKKRIKDNNVFWLLDQVIESFCICSPNSYSHLSSGSMEGGKGIPLGNLTSQIFANIYLNELDQFVKQKLRIKHYLRYADDFIILSSDRKEVCKHTGILEKFLQKNLSLELHPKKIILRKLEWGIDFLGYIVLPHYVLPRTKTRKRIFKKFKEKIESASFNQSLQSYLGYFKHAKSYKLTQKLKNEVWFFENK